MCLNPRSDWRRKRLAASRLVRRPRLDVLESRCVPAYLVTSSGDDITQQGTLRYELAKAPSGAVIQITAAVPSITLYNGELFLSRSLTIETQGGDPVTISGNYSSRVFEISAKAHVTLYNLIITGGNGVANNPLGSVSLENSGGGILNFGTLTLGANKEGRNGITRFCEVTDNNAQDSGGGIANYLGSLRINGTVQYNSATNGGGIANIAGTVIVAGAVDNNSASDAGGIENDPLRLGKFRKLQGGTLTIAGGTVSNNSASEFGGGILNEDSKVVIDKGSMFSGNSARQGGAIYNLTAAISDDGDVKTGAVTSNGATFSGNYASQDGAGIYNSLGQVAFHNSILELNNADDSGGAIYIGGGTVSVDSNSQIADNSAQTGGGAYVTAVNSPLPNAGGHLTVKSSEFNGNTAVSQGGAIDCEQSSLGTNDANINNNFAPLGAGIYNTGSASILKGDIAANTATSGGGIYNSGGISLHAVTVEANQASSFGDGGGMYNTGNVNLVGGEFRNNSAMDDGGGIFNAISGYLTLDNAKMDLNMAGNFGGAIANEQGNVAVNDNSDIESNSVSGGDNAYPSGGAIFTDGGVVQISSSTLIANSAANGGAIEMLDGANVTANIGVINSNTAAYEGGGIYCDASTLVMGVKSKLDDCSALAAGGGIYAADNSSLVLANTEVSRDQESNPQNIYFLNGGGGGGIIAIDSGLIVTACNFTDDTSDTYNGGDVGGGAIDAIDSIAVISDTSFVANFSNEGGAISCWQNTENSNLNVTISNCRFLNNQGPFGSAIVSVSIATTLTLGGNYFHGNSGLQAIGGDTQDVVSLYPGFVDLGGNTGL